MSQRRGKPYNPAKDPKPVLVAPGQLGIANQYRQQHSKSGYDVEQLAVGFERGGGVVRSRERAMLTHPALIAELYNAMMLKLVNSGQQIPERIEIKQTPGDRATAQHRGILWGYLSTRIEVLKGAVKIADYEGVPKSGDLHKLPLTQKQFDRRRFYAWVREQTGMAIVTDFLDRIVEHDNPELAADADAILTKHEMGEDLIGTQNRRDAENAVYGALSLSARILAEAARDFHTVESRYWQQIEIAKRRKLA
jgi:hypothetical protein